MVRKNLHCSTVISSLLLYIATSAYGIERGPSSGERQSPGGSWGERSHQAGSTHHQHQYSQGEQRSTGEAGGRSEFGQQGATGEKSAGARKEGSSTADGKDAAAG